MDILVSALSLKFLLLHTNFMTDFRPFQICYYRVLLPYYIEVPCSQLASSLVVDLLPNAVFVGGPGSSGRTGQHVCPRGALSDL